MISISRIPNDHTSDLMVKEPKLMASGAVHLMGNLAPECVVVCVYSVKLKRWEKSLEDSRL